MSLPTPELAARDPHALVKLDAWLLALSAEERVDWALRELPGVHVLSSSFGAQSAVSLHLLTQRWPTIPVIVVDTGYLFAETYRFIDELTERLSLNLQVVRPSLSPAWLEARHGELWAQGRDGLDQYNRLAKVEPMQQALSELGAGTWFAGLRRQQSLSRANAPVLDHRHGRWKVHPIIDWTDRDIGLYLRRHDLPYHPLWDKGYVSIGDTHTTRRWEPGMREEDTRFFGIKRECGLHLDV
ncbi:phosphoadenylyl-sulfate reductase [Dyella flava]|uniref:Phosphoadenosine 5'-phosphosulfate reductase n=1 Tax=Dyella flava TaxID=1920170 RepID=A0ABS2K299_9GAMM|nr:phosphoadenylyl-sulfate reductase [Dyella flava]MBM7125376.1 phosphoadenylyl-sulfate reductase [Dyella flava]GLQ51764.1 phosphoadenosine phosphosulfate reductase [Dyella flava]